MARKLGSDEQALWGRVIDTVRPLHPARSVADAKAPAQLIKMQHLQKSTRPPINSTGVLPPTKRSTRHSSPVSLKTALDGHWDRRIDKGAIVPDISVDLHGTALSGAYTRLDNALELAILQRFKIVLLVTGKARTHDRASGSGRGAIAAVVRDWLSASRHSGHIAAVRNAHPRHGGDGALYIILKR
jgi:DNA-nicking Smr family endonuclease